MWIVTRREIVAGATALPLVAPSSSASMPTGLLESHERGLSTLWREFLKAEARLAAAWEVVERIQSQLGDEHVVRLFDRADAIGHEHDCIVRQIAAHPAATWQGVTIKLLTWRRTASLSASNLLDADTALAFSAYLDALRLCPGAMGAANDDAIARAALRHQSMAGGDK